MSELSYLQKVKFGVTGAETQLPVCMPAACERIIPRSLSVETYACYIGACAVDDTLGLHKRVKNKIMTLAYDMIAIDAGLDSSKDFGFENVRTKEQLDLLLKHLVKQDYAVILDIDAPYGDEQNQMDYDPLDEPHAIGLLPIDDTGTFFRALSSWTPAQVEGIVDVSTLWDQLLHQKDPYWREFKFHDANVTFFPRVHL